MKFKTKFDFKILRIVYLVQIFSLCFNASAQQVCGTPAELSTNCSDACILCDINGFTAYSPSGVLGNMPPGFCTQFQHGVHYIGFIPQTNFLDLNISIYNCLPASNSGGLEMGIYKSDNCIDFDLVSNCNTNMYNNQTWPINSNKPLIPGKIYYLVIDENGPNSCSFSVAVAAGSTKAEPVVFSGNIKGPVKLCPGQTASYMVPPASGNPCEFNWTLDGNPVGSGKTIDLTITDPGTHQLCVHAANLCFPDGDETCIDVVVKEIPVTKVGPFTVCEEDLPFDYGNESYFIGGTYQVSYTTPKNCDSLVEFDLKVIPVKIKDLGSIYLCRGDSFQVNNVFFSKPGNYEELISTNYPPYCDSTVYFQIITDTVIAEPFVTQLLDCFTSEVPVTGTSSYPKDNLTFKWFDTNITLLGTDTVQMISDTGTYYLVALHQNQISGKVCTDTTLFKVYRDSLLPAVYYKDLPAYCEGDIVDLNLSVPVDSSMLGGIFTYHSGLPCDTGNEINQPFSAIQDSLFYICYKAGNCKTETVLPLQVNLKPWAIIVTNDTICNSSANGNTTLYDFSSTVKQGDANGLWQPVTVNPASGIFPVLDFSGVVPGNYLFSYTTQSALAPCQETAYQLEINVRECSCPNVVIDGNKLLCNSGQTYDLNNLIVNSEKGSFKLVAVPPGSNPALIQNSTLIFNQSDPGIYEFVFQLDSILAGCPNSFPGAIEIIADNEAVLVPQVSVCGDTIKGIAGSQIIKNSLFLSGDQNGSWSSANLVSMNLNNSVWDFNGIMSGTYLVQYDLPASFPCQDKSYSLTVIVKDCSCPEFELITKNQICQSLVNFDLNQYIISAPPGYWSIVSSPNGGIPGTISGSAFICDGCMDGKYVLSYKVYNPFQNCPDSMAVELLVTKENEAGTLKVDLEFCENTDSLIALSDQLNGEDSGGKWYIKKLPVATDWTVSNPDLVLKNLNPGVYQFMYVADKNKGCVSDSAFFNLTIDKMPVLKLLKDTFISCQYPEILIVPQVTSFPSHTLEWSSNGVFLNSDPTLKIKNGGIIDCKVTSGQCTVLKSFVVKDFNKPIKSAGLKVYNPDCLHKKGRFKLLNLSGGTPPIHFSLNKQEISFTDSLELDEGQHFLKYTDNYGCIWDTTAFFKKEAEPTLKLPDDITIESGDSYTIDYKTSPAGVTAESLKWIENEHPFDCLNCESITVAPVFTSSYELIMKSSSGCFLKDAMKIYVTTNRRVFIPNGFSPNGDNVNDVFAIYGGKNTIKVDVFEIFDRWGDKVHTSRDFIPDGQQGSWNGKIGDKDASIGVYVYYTIIEFADGKKELFKGDLNLLR